ncbi:MAG: helix-turn-helix domain-containing protein [Bacteroidota bacterium]
MREAQKEAGQRLARDLRRLREQQEVRLEDIEAATKVRVEQIEAFERDALVGAGQSNQIYVRSFVRQYAGLVGLDPDVVLAALDAARAGRYEGTLGAEPTDTPPAPAPAAAPVPEVPAPEAQAPAPEPEAPAPEPEVQAAPVAQGEEAPLDVKPPPAPSPVPGRRAPEAAPVKASASPDRSPGAGRPSLALVVVGLIFAGLMVAAVTVGPSFWEGTTQDPVPEPDPARPEAVAQPAPPAEPAPPPVLVLPDTLEVLLVALNDGVQNMRVRPDENVRRPHWLEPGDSLSTQFTEQLTLQFTRRPRGAPREMSDVRIVIEGADYPQTERVNDSMLVITRGGVQAVLDSVRVHTR